MNLFRKFLASLTPTLVLMALTLSLIGGAINVTPAHAATITVNTTTDEFGAGASCSLREAIQAANNNVAFGGCPAGASGADTISIPPGTYQLTIANAGGVNEDNNATGDLDILESLTLQGAGSGSTIIQAGTNNTNGIDKVIAANPLCSTVVNVTIDGVTIRYGRNSQPHPAADFSHTGGGIDYCAGGGSGAFTLSNSIVSDNTNVNAYGGALNMDAYLTPNYTATITNVTFSNNRTLHTTLEANGGAINIFGDQMTVNITGSTFTSNTTANPNSAGGAIFFRPSALTVGPTSSLNISSSTFSSNTAAGSGGAIAASTFGTGTAVSISNSSFTGNTATASFGGAIYLNGSVATTTPFNLSHLTITGNTAGSEGGGVYVGKSNVTMTKSFIVGNNAPTAKGLRKSVDAATATVTNNWWGCSTGPGAAPCDTVSTAGGTLSFSPWYRNQLTATTSPLVTNQTTSLTASFLTNSANTAVPLADISEIIGKTITWAGTNGFLYGLDLAVQPAGTATGFFQAASAGTAVISAQVNNDNIVPVSSNVLSLTVGKANTTTMVTNAATLASTPTVTGQPVTVTYTVTGAFGNSPTAPTGNVTVTDGTDSCTASAAAGTCNIIFRTAGVKTLTATYAGDSNFNTSFMSFISHTVNKADTTSLIVSMSPEPSVTGGTVTFNVSVSANSPGAAVAPTTVTGSVTVSDGGTNTCIATLTAGAGSCTIAFPHPGNFSMTGSYSGDTNFNASSTAPMLHQVNKADTTTTISSDLPDPSVKGEAVTVNFSVAVTAPGAGTPTGNVTVSDGTNSCTATAAAGTCDITFTTAGAKSLTATYVGDSDFNGSASSPATPHTVNKAATTTSITSDLPDPSVVGEVVTVNFSVSVTAPGAGTPTGNVTVSDGVDSCVGTVASGTCNITFTTVGAKSLTATYAGDSNFNGSVSSPATAHTVNKADTTTSITSDLPDPSVFGETVTVNFTVSVTAPGGGTPSGNVTVTDGVDSCVGTAASGTCNITFTSPGAKSLTATYAGDSNFNGSASSPATSHTVNKADATATITSDLPDPSVFGQTVTVNFTVVASAPGAGTPTGNVTVSDGVDSCNATVAVGTCDITFTTAGAKSLTATYAGDSNFNGSASSPVTSHTVNKANTTTSITSDAPDASIAGTVVTVNFSVAVTAPGAGTPTGNVTVSDGTDSCVGTVAAGTCNITLTTIGSRTLTATYAGDSNFNGSASTGEPHTVDGYATTTTITSDNPDPSVTGQAVTVQFSVTTGTGTPTGNVTVTDGTDSCIGTVAAGQCDITFTSAGVKSLTATYAGDLTHIGSVSASESHTVNKADTTTTITSDSPDPSSAVQVVTVNFTVVANAPGSGTPTGNVTVSDGVDSCVGTVAAGTCNLTLTTGGTRTLTASYGGDSSFNGSSSAGVSHFVDNSAPGVSITKAAGQADPTTAATINFTVTFTEAVSDFDDASDVDLSASTASGTLSTVISGGPTIYNVAVTGMTGSGDVIASIPASSAVDGVGNFNTLSTSGDNVVAWILDVTGPDTTIDSHPSNPSNNPSAFFGFSGADDHSAPGSLTFECQLDTGGFSACTSPHNLAGLSLGVHTFQVRAIDEANNTDPTPASYTWEVIEGPVSSLIGAACTDTSLQASGRMRFQFDTPSVSAITISLASNSNTTLVPNRGIRWAISGNRVTLYIQAAYAKTGVAELTLNVSDGLTTSPMVITVHVGGNGDDVMTGTAGYDLMFGMNGNDTLSGGGDADVLCGGLGRDTLNGEAGNDYLDGFYGNDTLNGGDDDDNLHGNAGIDTMTGGLGADFFSGGPGIDITTDYNVSEGDTKDITTP